MQSNGWTDPLFTEFVKQVRAEVDESRQKFPAFHSMHEGYGVLAEEFKELEQETFKQFSLRSYSNIIRECIQISAMAFCIVAETIPDVLPVDIAEGYDRE